MCGIVVGRCHQTHGAVKHCPVSLVPGWVDFNDEAMAHMDHMLKLHKPKILQFHPTANSHSCRGLKKKIKLNFNYFFST